MLGPQSIVHSIFPILCDLGHARIISFLLYHYSRRLGFNTNSVSHRSDCIILPFLDVDINLRSRDYVIIPQTIIHSFYSIIQYMLSKLYLLIPQVSFAADTSVSSLYSLLQSCIRRHIIDARSLNDLLLL